MPPGSPNGEYPAREETPKSTHARPRTGEVSLSAQTRVVSLKVYFPGSKASRRHSRLALLPSPHPVRTLRTLRETPSDTFRDPSESLPSVPMGPVSAEDGRSIGHRPDLGRGKSGT